MNNEHNNSLDSIPANRKLLDKLHSQKLISLEARDHALKLIHPSQNWGLWISRLLTLLGVSLILSGIIYFAAFNWEKITPQIKLISIQVLIFSCLASSYFSGINKVSGKILLLCSSILVGVFLAVFGQIYQTGADAYTLFFTWSLLILPWVAISEFAGLWMTWIIICNIFIILYFRQTGTYDWEAESHIPLYLILLNLVCLGLREYFTQKNIDWLKPKWIRAVLTTFILICSIIAAANFIWGTNQEKLIFEIIAAIFVLSSFYVIYRYKLPDLWSLANTILSGCIIFEIFLFRIMEKVFSTSFEIGLFIIGILTIFIFSFAIILLKDVAKKIRRTNV